MAWKEQPPSESFARVSQGDGIDAMLNPPLTNSILNPAPFSCRGARGRLHPQQFREQLRLMKRSIDGAARGSRTGGCRLGAYQCGCDGLYQMVIHSVTGRRPVTPRTVEQQTENLRVGGSPRPCPLVLLSKPHQFAPLPTQRHCGSDSTVCPNRATRANRQFRGIRQVRADGLWPRTRSAALTML